MKNVMSFVVELEMSALFENAKETVRIHLTIDDMIHSQHATSLQVNNKYAEDIAPDTTKQIHTKVIDMGIYWIKDRIKLLQFLVHWQ